MPLASYHIYNNYLTVSTGFLDKLDSTRNYWINNTQAPSNALQADMTK